MFTSDLHLRMAALALVLFAAVSSAQAQRGDATASPQVLPDHTVTFRLRAPKAMEVTLLGDWMFDAKPVKLTKDDGGTWSVVVGPLATGIAIYNFNVDGMDIADPINPRMKLRARTSASLVEIPAAPTDFWVQRDVPHGVVEVNYEKSKVLNGETRAFRVYTPPGYAASGQTRYPVLYLLHGSNDTAAGWTDAGQANFILDNALADKKAVPMIVVMPFGHAAPFTGGGGNNTTLFEQYLLQDVMPAVEKTYRVAPGRENCAIVGLSMGGGQALHIGFSHLDQFSGIGAFSSAIPGDFETRFAALLADPAGTNAKLKLLWMACGKQDPGFTRISRFSEQLDTHKITHTYRISEGGHTYTNWRQYLGEITPLLFQPGQKS